MTVPKILIIDDEPANITSLTGILNPYCEVFTVESGADALQWVDSGNIPDLILLNVRMPDIDGYEVCRRLKAGPQTESIPVIFITALDDVENETMGLLLGAVDYITRPFSPAIVQTRVKNHLELARARKASEQRYQALFEGTADGIAIFDLTGCILEANEPFCKNTGYPYQELIKMNIGEIEHPADAPARAERFASLLQERCGLFEVTHVRRDSTVFPVEVSARLIELDGKPAVLSICRDITRRKQMEEELGRYREELENLVERRTEELRQKELMVAELGWKKRRSLNGLVGESTAMQILYSRIEELADVASTVLITGESGTGKTLVAEALHFGGVRSKGPLIKVACSDLSESLIESELFGHVRGAFTGAVRDRAGRFQAAGDGTLFFDEIGDIPLQFQKRLLRVLDERKYERVGDNSPLDMQARIIAATHRNLSEMVHQGEFRADLYYRLKVMELRLVPLRERVEDIPLLVSHFLDRFSVLLNRRIMDVSTEVLGLLLSHSWPGNVRELMHVLEHACVRCKDRVITVENLPQDFGASVSGGLNQGLCSPDEVRAIHEALRMAGGNKAKAARLLNVSRRTFYRKLEKHLIGDEADG